MKRRQGGSNCNPIQGRHEALLDSSSALLVDIVFGFQTLQQRLEERLVRFRSSADGLGHLFRGGREVAFIRIDARQRQMADPVVRVFLGDLWVYLESPLGVSLPLQTTSVHIQLYRACFVQGGG